MGTDVAVVGSMVFAAQLLLSAAMGHIITLVGSTVATVYAAATFALCGAICASQIKY